MRDWQIRAIVILFLVVFPPQTVPVYLIAAFVMKRRPQQLFRDPEEEEFWRSVSGRPARTFHSLRHKFRELEERLSGLARPVTSPEYSLNRQFRDLETRLTAARLMAADRTRGDSGKKVVVC